MIFITLYYIGAYDWCFIRAYDILPPNRSGSALKKGSWSKLFAFLLHVRLNFGRQFHYGVFGWLTKFRIEKFHSFGIVKIIP